MPTSGTTTFNLTAAQIVTYAFQKLGLVRGGGAPTANELAEGVQELDALLKAWTANGPFISTKASGTFPLVSATASYDLTTLRPLRILQASYRDSSNRSIPMIGLTRDAYFNLPLRDVAGIPTQYFFDPQRAAFTFYTWPVLAVATTEVIEVVYQRRIQDVGIATNTLDIPQEHLRMVGYNLAEALLPNYGLSDQVAQLVVAEAQKLKQEVLDFDRDDLVTFQPGALHGGW
jgi:hypothetical protein